MADGDSWLQIKSIEKEIELMEDAGWTRGERSIVMFLRLKGL
jgi:hypothetical protein